MRYEIVSGMPLPARKRGNGSGRSVDDRYRFDLLGIGDAILIPADDAGFYARQGGVQWHRVQASASQFSKRNNVKLEVRSLDDGRVGVWRTA